MSADITLVLRTNADDLLRYFRRRLAPEDAADAVAEVMTTAWRRERDLPSDPTCARMWLFGIARNVLMHAQRGEVRRSRLADRRTLASRSAPSRRPWARGARRAGPPRGRTRRDRAARARGRIHARGSGAAARCAGIHRPGPLPEGEGDPARGARPCALTGAWVMPRRARSTRSCGGSRGGGGSARRAGVGRTPRAARRA